MSAESTEDKSMGRDKRKKEASRLKLLAKAFTTIVIVSFIGGLVGGFLGMGVLDRWMFGDSVGREVVLQESSAIIDVVDELEPSVVNITSSGAPRYDIFGREFEGRTGAGTGLIIGQDGLVITNRHVVPEGSEISITTHDETVHENVDVVGRDPLNDLAYLNIDTDSELKPAELGNSDEVVVGQKSVAIGNVLGQFTNTVTSGIISAIGRPVAATGQDQVEYLQGLLQTDAAINPGNSGGPLVNIEGQVIGINTAVAGNAEGIGFAIPINQAKAGIESVKNHGELLKPYLGVRYATIDNELAAEEGLPVEDGAYVRPSSGDSPVISDSPADEAGIQAGDIITAVDGQKLNQRYPLSARLSRYQVGDTVELTVLRDGETITTTANLQETPEGL